MACLFTRQAESDLENIADYIALDSPGRAVSFVQEMRERCHRIADAPRGYQLTSEYGEQVRKVPFGNYLLLYTIVEEDVIVLHIAHSARALPLDGPD